MWGAVPPIYDTTPPAARFCCSCSCTEGCWRRQSYRPHLSSSEVDRSSGCGRNFRDSISGIGNPIRATQEISGLLPRKPTEAEKTVSLRQSDNPGGIQIWGSNPAMIWSSEKPEEEGIHVHAYKQDGELADPDETFSAVEMDGVNGRPDCTTNMLPNSQPPARRDSQRF